MIECVFNPHLYFLSMVEGLGVEAGDSNTLYIRNAWS